MVREGVIDLLAPGVGLHSGLMNVELVLKVVRLGKLGFIIFIWDSILDSSVLGVRGMVLIFFSCGQVDDHERDGLPPRGRGILKLISSGCSSMASGSSL